MADATASEIGTSVFPVIKYRNIPAAIDWLCDAFGFEKHHITVGVDGAIMEAQLTLGTTMVMIGPAHGSAFDRLVKQPDEIDGAETQVCYFLIADAHAHCARAKAAGAQIIFEIEDKEKGRRSYSCRDPEGHLWHFGTYDPWQDRPVRSAPDKGYRSIVWGAAKRSVLAAGLLAIAVAAILAGNGLPPTQAIVSELGTRVYASPPHQEEAAATAEELLREQLTRERTALAAVQRNANETRARLTRALSDLEAAEKAAKEVRALLAQALNDKEAAERFAKELQERLATTSISNSATEPTVKEVRRRSPVSVQRPGISPTVAIDRSWTGTFFDM